VAEKLVEAYSTLGFGVETGLFREPFHVEGLFQHALEGSSSDLDRLDLLDRADRYVFLYATFGEPRSSGVGEFETVDGQARATVFGRHGELLSVRSTDVPGAGMDASAARMAAASRLGEKVVELAGLDLSHREAEPEVPATSVVSPRIESTFDGQALEGWTAYRQKIENPGAGGSGGGSNNGCLIVTGDRANTGYFIAPQRYHGDWRKYSRLEIDLWSAGGKYFDSGYQMQGDILLSAGSAYAWRLLPSRPPEQWKTFLIALDDDGQWTFGGGATCLTDVLANVTDFRIRGEYGVKKDQCGLDNVRLFGR
jgi:hypothetical protein